MLKIIAVSFRWVALLCLIATLLACEQSVTEFRMRPLEHLPQEVADPLAPIFEQNSDLRIVSAEADNNASGVRLLADGEVDLALVENSSPFHSSVRIVLPAYKSVLHLMIRNDVDFSDIEQPLRDKSIYIMEGSAAGKAFLKMTASRQGLKPADYEIATTLQPGKADIVIYFGPINPGDVSWYLPGYHLYSLEQDDAERAMSSEAIGYLLPRMEPKVIPAHTYGLPGNEKAVHTLEVDALLATRRDVSENAIYELTKILVERKPWFAAVAPEIFSDLR